MIAMGIHSSCHYQILVSRTALAVTMLAVTTPGHPTSAREPWHRVVQRAPTSSYCSHTFQEKKLPFTSQQRTTVCEVHGQNTACDGLGGDTQEGRKAGGERVKKKSAHCRAEKSFLFLERETLRYPCDISFHSSYTAEASKTSLPLHFLANYICVLDWI